MESLPALDSAVDKAVKSGLHFAVAAGVYLRRSYMKYQMLIIVQETITVDACNYSPAAAELAVTVGASTLGDQRAYFSNHGSCVDVFAPGLKHFVYFQGQQDRHRDSLWNLEWHLPHTAGLLAYLLSIYPSPEFDPTFDAADNVISIQSTPHSLVALQQRSIPLVVLRHGTHRALPAFITYYLPSPHFLDVVLQNVEAAAPIPPKTLTPAQLKKALLALSSNGLLEDLPAQTVNKLIYNNATA